MRVVVIGCEYSGQTTLVNDLLTWGRRHGMEHHMDDHFTIPDAYHLSEEEQQGMIDMLPAIKERFNRFQVVYHIRLLHEYEHILMCGFHIEEMIYGPLYYYPELGITDEHKVRHTREYEKGVQLCTNLWIG